MHCLLSVVSILIDFRYIHVCDWASHTFLPMIPCKGCSLAKIQHHSLSSLIRVPHHHFTYDTVLREHSHTAHPTINMYFYNADGCHVAWKIMKPLLMGNGSVSIWYENIKYTCSSAQTKFLPCPITHSHSGTGRPVSYHHKQGSFRTIILVQCNSDLTE
jgi:hypothetical protein